MAGIYEALVRADRERNPTAPSTAEVAPDDPYDLTAVGSMLQRLEDRADSEITDDFDAGFEHFASLEVSLGALEDRIDEREREQRTASADLAALVARLVAEVGELTSRIDHDFPLLRDELIDAIEGRVAYERAPAGDPYAGTDAEGGLAAAWRRLFARRPPAPPRLVEPR